MSVSTLKRLYTGAAFIATIAITAFQTSAQAQTPISTAAELSAVRNNPSGEYYLVNNIDMSTLPAGAAFEPIGNYQTPFTGELDGRGFEVRNLRVSKRNVTDGRVGLFGQIGPGGRVRNLGVTGASVVGGFAVGALAGANNGVVTNCYSTGKVEAVRGQESNAGGLVGHNGGTIERSRSSATVIGGDNVGGLVGFLTIVNNRGEIKDCNASGDVEGNNNVGGLVGYIFGGKVEKSYSITRLSKSRTAAQSARHGGLVGTEFFEGRASNNTVGRMPDGSFVKPAHIYNSFWDIDIAGVGNTSSGGGSQTGVTSADMTNPNTFTDKGWEVITAVDPANPGAADGKWVITSGGNSVPQLVTVVKDNNNAVTKVTEIHSVTYTIDAAAAEQGSVRISGDTLKTPGQSISTTAATASVGAVVVAVPKAGSEFVAWTVGGNVVSTDSVFAYVAEGNATVIPIFREIPKVPTSIVNFSVANGIGGSIIAEGSVPGLCQSGRTCTTLVASWLSSNSFDFPANTSMTIRAVPDSGFEFAAWSDSVKTNPRMITAISGGMNFEAVFARGTGIVVDPCNDIETVTPDCPNYCVLVPTGTGCVVVDPCDDVATVTPDCPNYCSLVPSGEGCQDVSYSLDMQVLKNGIVVDTVTAGEEVTLRVTAKRNGVVLPKVDGSSFIIEFGGNAGMLQSGVILETDSAFGTGQTYTKDYTVSFWNRGGKFKTTAVGLWKSGNDSVWIVGEFDITVNHGVGTPAKVEFVSPVPHSRLVASMSYMHIDSTYIVQIFVTDANDNSIGAGHEVGLVAPPPLKLTGYTEHDVHCSESSDYYGNDNKYYCWTVAMTNASGVATFRLKVDADYYDSVVSGDTTDIWAFVNVAGSDQLRDIAGLRILRDVSVPAGLVFLNALTYDQLLDPNDIDSYTPINAGDVYNVEVMVVNKDGNSAGAGHRVDFDLTGSGNFAVDDPAEICHGSYCYITRTTDSEGKAYFPVIVDPSREHGMGDWGDQFLGISAIYYAADPPWNPIPDISGALRIVPQASLAPAPFVSELSVGPNPVSLSADGEVALFWDGGAIKSASLYVYSSTGSRVGKLSVREPTASASSSLSKRNAASLADNGRRRIGEWKMRDKRSRPVASGTYLIRGVVKTVDGKRERVSVVVGVR